MYIHIEGNNGLKKTIQNKNSVSQMIRRLQLLEQSTMVLENKYESFSILSFIKNADRLIFLGNKDDSFKCSSCVFEWIGYYTCHKLPKSCRKLGNQSCRSLYKRKDSSSNNA